MYVPRQHVLDVLRRVGRPEDADLACQDLPDPVGFDEMIAFFNHLGLGLDDLMQQLGASP